MGLSGKVYLCKGAVGTLGMQELALLLLHASRGTS